LSKSKCKDTFVPTNKKQFKMKITVTGSLGNTAKPLTEILVTAGHDVTVVSSNADKKAAIEALGAKAAIGSVKDAGFLSKAFDGADAVYAMTPPNMSGANILTNMKVAGEAFVTALRNAGVKRIVMLTSIGAHLPNGNGPIAGVHAIEQMYNQLEGVSITYLRAGYFYFNFYGNIPMIKGAGIIGANYPATTLMPLVHPHDIAVAAAEELQKQTGGKNVRYIVSDVRPAGDLAKVLGKAIGKEDLPWIEFTDEQSIGGMTEAGISEEMAGLYTEMGAGLRTGKIQADFEKQGSPVTGQTKLEDFAKEFAAGF
jgi:uncharacterized protein YbjT (DUF2867 family)